MENSLSDDPIHGSELRTDDPDEVVEVAQDVDAEQSRTHAEDVKVELMIRQDATVTQAVDIAVDLPLQIGHPPAPVDEKEGRGQPDLKARAGKVRPEAHVREAERLHELVQIAHILPGHGVDVLPPQRVLYEELVKLFDFVAGREGPESERVLYPMCICGGQLYIFLCCVRASGFSWQGDRKKGKEKKEGVERGAFFLAVPWSVGRPV